MASDNNSHNSSDHEETTALLAMHLACGSVLPMVLKSAIELNLLELIKKADSGSASASELASQLPTKNPEAPHMIDRILRLLAAYDVLICSVEHASDADFERRYSLGPLCKYLTKNEDGVSLGWLSILIQDKVFMESWYNLKDAVLEGGVPFDRAHGMNAFEYPATDPRFNDVFNQAMSNHSTIFVKKLLQIYKGFEGLSSLVDVGGGIGTTINMIVSKHPTIKGINFDLPHVLKHAPSYPGVEHVGGDMFVSVPKADAIFMKWICHDWGDEHCQKLLKNCYESLPENGKVIIADAILPQTPEKGLAYQRSVLGDVMMMSFNPGGKERSENEFEALAKQAGFHGIQKICCVLNVWIIELHK